MSAANYYGGDAPPHIRPELRSQRTGEPGFVKRFANFDSLQQKAQRWRGTAMPKGYISDIITWLPTLTATEKDVLRVEVSFIDPEDLKIGAGGCTQKCAEYTAMRIGKPVSTVKRARRALEAKGFLIRHIDGDNNAARTDVRPFLVDVDRYREVFEAGFEARRTRFDKAMQFDTMDDEMISRGAIEDTHIQSLQTSSNSVPLANASNAESAWPADNLPQRNLNGPSPSPIASSSVRAEDCSPGGARGFSRSSRGRLGRAETARAALTEAYRQSASLASYIRQADIDRLDLPALYAGCERAVAELLPERNTLKTWEWAVKNHGWGAIVRLIVALDDPSVRNRYAFFGALAEPAGTRITIDDGFRSNLARIARRREQGELAADAAELAADRPDEVEPAAPAENGQAEPPFEAAAPGDVAAQWERVRTVLRDEFGEAAYRSWLSSLALVGVAGGTVRIEVPDKFLRDWVLAHYADRIRSLWLAQNRAITRVEVTIARA